MKVILQKPVDKLGVPGDVADVADGYARNYLIPQGMAVKASKNMVNHADSLRRAHEKRRYAMKGEYEAQASKVISGGPIRVAAKADSTRRFWEPLEQRVDDFELHDAPCFGGVARTVAGTKPAA